MRKIPGLYLLLLSAFLVPAHLFAAVGQQGQAPPAATAPPAPAAERTTPGGVVTDRSGPEPAQGLIALDVVVTDRSGKPVTGLAADDFTLLDNGQASKIVSFQAFDGGPDKPSPPVEVILVIDTLNLSFKLALHEQEEAEKFLRQNGGHLAEPVSVYGLNETGLWTLAQVSGDGNVLADEIAQNRMLPVARRSGSGNTEAAFRSIPAQSPPALVALKALGEIAMSARGKPGRKLLIWIGPGWGLGSGSPFFSELDREQLFNAIEWYSTLLREARIALYTLSVGEKLSKAGTYQSAFFYQEFLPPVRAERQASIGNLDRRVLAEQSGGRVVDPHKNMATSYGYNGYTMTMSATASRATELAVQIADFDLAGEIDSCVEEAAAFYSLTFNPAYTVNTDEYHDLKVEAGRPGQPELTARTNTGYYDQPYFYDEPGPALKRVTIEQLKQRIGAASGRRDAELAGELSGEEISGRLDDATLTALEGQAPGPRTIAALVALADESAFQDSGAAESSGEPAPDFNEQERILSSAGDYVNTVMPRLPNFFATRVTSRYEETPEHYDSTGRRRIAYQPLHWVDISKETVLYRNGREIVDPGVERQRKAHAQEAGLATRGTFGSILGAANDAIAIPGGMTWSRWERGAAGSEAVFRYAIPKEKSRFQVGYCCLPKGEGTGAFHMLAGYHGEVTIDPRSGAILRLTLQADLDAGEPLARAGMPLTRSDLRIEYGPVEIGGKTYICPLHAISIARSRTVKILAGLPGEFRTFGPFATSLNDVTFDHYHLFRSDVRILSGPDAAALEK